MNKVVFYLLNEKGFHVLDEFLTKFNANKIEYIVLAEDKNIKKDYYVELVNVCNDFSIKYYRKEEFIPSFTGYKFAIGWKWIISDTNNLIVLHDSILPKYRGFAPLVNMLINGESELGVTALFASNEYDKGNIIKQEKVAITYPIKISKAIEIISPLYSNLVNYICDLIFTNQKIIYTKQNEENATYSLWRDEQDYFINWNDDSKTIRRMIDSVGYPYNGAKTYLNNQLIVIYEVEEYLDIEIENRDVGKVIFLTEGYPIVVCGKGLLKIIKAKYADEQSILPLKKFRSRFGGKV